MSEGLSQKIEVKQVDRWANRPKRALAFLSEKGVLGLCRVIREAGFEGTTQFIGRQLRYNLCAWVGKNWDRANSVDTSGQFDLEDLVVVGGNKAQGRPVVSTSPKQYRFLSQFHPRNKADYSFLDIGSGKGRVVLLAAEDSFRKVMGVEFSKLACEIAECNLTTFKRPVSVTGKCEFFNRDVLDFELPNEPLVINCFNPFGAEVWRKFLKRIVQSYRDNPRPIRMLIYGTVPEDVKAAVDEVETLNVFSKRFEGDSPHFIDSYLEASYVVYDLDSVK